MRFTFVILLFCCLGADAQMIIKAHPNYVPFAAGITPPLDIYTGAAAAYSLRKLRTAYTGSAIRVRRSNDNTEQDIGFTSSGDLDTGALKTFVGAGNNGFVTTWYSQGDSTAVNFTQTTAANQPRIVNAGVIDRQNGKPSFVFDGTRFMDVSSSTASFNYLHKTGQTFISIVARVNSNSFSYVLLDNCGTSSNFTGHSSFTQATGIISSFIGRSVSGQFTVDNRSGNVISANALFLYQNEFDNGNATASERSKIYINSGSAIQNNIRTSTPSTGNASFSIRLGRVANGTTASLSGNISEIIIWNYNQSSNRNAISTNINSYYGIY
jgi:hypothetical protein